MKTRPEADFSSPLCQPYEVRQGEHGVLLMRGFAGSAAHMRPLAEGLVQQHLDAEIDDQAADDLVDQQSGQALGGADHVP